jgi:hypothetical protein
MKNILTALLLLIGVTCHAQVTPQYYIDYHPNYPTPPYIAGIQAESDTAILQNLYMRDSFTTAPPPYGRVKNIYLRTGVSPSPYDTVHWKGCKATKLLLSMANVNLQNFDTVTRLVTGLTLVASVDTLTTGTVMTEWIKIPVDPENPFYIDTSKNLVFQLAFDTGGHRRWPDTTVWLGCAYWGSFFGSTSASWFFMGGPRSNDRLPSKDAYFYDFGIDLYPLGIDDLQNVSDLRIYPNPSQGRFVISIAAKHIVREGQLTISDMAGRAVWQQQYQNIDDKFYQKIDMSAYPKGIYIAELRADGERITRKLVVQ